jgi:hypothetical protein|tara:strand:+ start:378 stop:968 length:591 start_codon:yes stop_codon:yes gene_type:complete
LKNKITHNTIILVYLLILSSCALFQKKNKVPLQPAQLVSIKAIDLSEDRSTLSSNNDEILVSIFFGSQQDKIWYFNGYRLETMEFDSAHSNYTLDSVELSTDFDCQDCTAFICLTEIDTDGSEDSTHAALERLLNTVGYKALDTKSMVDTALPDNDFLGVIKLPYFVPEMGTEYRIEGKDLLDSYAYDIKISIKSK